MTQEATKQRFATYSQYAKNWLIENEIKLKTVYINDGNYNPHFIYINRIAACNPKTRKFRVLKQGDNVKNCIMITFNVERHDRDYLVYLIRSKLHLFKHFAHGSCQSFLNQNIVAEILSGVIDNKGNFRKEVLY